MKLSRLFSEADQDRREMERSSAADPGDTNVKIKLLRQQMRSGNLDRAKVELAAQLGDGISLELFPDAEQLDYAAGQGGVGINIVLDRFSAVGGDPINFICDVAEGVLPKFEEVYPDDNRPRLAIEAARSGDVTNAVAIAAAAAVAAVNINFRAAYFAAVSVSYVVYAIVIRHENQEGIAAFYASLAGYSYERQVDHLIELLLNDSHHVGKVEGAGLDLNQHNPPPPPGSSKPAGWDDRSSPQRR